MTDATAATTSTPAAAVEPEGHRGLETARYIVIGIRIAVSIIVIGAFVLMQLAPRLGHPLVIIRGPSMEPTVPFGALVIERPAEPGDVVVGDVVTYTMPNGVDVTHRVIGIEGSGAEAMLVTQGDANPQPDPNTTPVTAVRGELVKALPKLGLFVMWLQHPSGMIFIASFLITLMLFERLIREYEADHFHRLLHLHRADPSDPADAEVSPALA